MNESEYLEQYGDKTYSELAELNDDNINDDMQEDLEEDRAEFFEMSQIMMTMFTLTEMFMADQITLEQYFRILDILDERETEVDATMMW
ncbi:hypothetical protein [Natrinema sp. DC36]|uniref:hypothetical protein n=1 Tax=Natrinema sp. DC36 TaxID=2878680 RepID=UPI001CF06D7B|nr:hypothetical protein [Natrinema sp. DC36]